MNRIRCTDINRNCYYVEIGDMDAERCVHCGNIRYKQKKNCQHYKCKAVALFEMNGKDLCLRHYEHYQAVAAGRSRPNAGRPKLFKPAHMCNAGDCLETATHKHKGKNYCETHARERAEKYTGNPNRVTELEGNL